MPLSQDEGQGKGGAACSLKLASRGGWWCPTLGYSLTPLWSNKQESGRRLGSFKSGALNPLRRLEIYFLIQ